MVQGRAYWGYWTAAYGSGEDSRWPAAARVGSKRVEGATVRLDDVRIGCGGISACMIIDHGWATGSSVALRNPQAGHAGAHALIRARLVLFGVGEGDGWAWVEEGRKTLRHHGRAVPDRG